MSWENAIDQGIGELWASLSGVPLKVEWAKKASQGEISEFERHQVYTKVPFKERWEITGKRKLE